MMKVDSITGNFLHKTDGTALVVVRVNPHGNPDSISYWKNSEGLRVKHHEGIYRIGALVDIYI
jgi:hypothetical protein